MLLGESPAFWRWDNRRLGFGAVGLKLFAVWGFGVWGLGFGVLGFWGF